MEPTPNYLTFSPSTSTTRSILVEPSERLQEPSERIQVPSGQSQGPSERIQEPSGQSEEPPERGLGQENSGELMKTIDRIAELKRIKASWTKIGEVVGLSSDVCIYIWEKHRWPPAISDPVASRRGLAWDSSEDEMLLKLHNAGVGWDVIGTSIKGRGKEACKSRFRWIGKTTIGPNDGQK